MLTESAVLQLAASDRPYRQQVRGVPDQRVQGVSDHHPRHPHTLLPIFHRSHWTRVSYPLITLASSNLHHSNLASVLFNVRDMM